MDTNPGLTDQSKIPLRRALGLFTSILLVAGTMIGSGVYKKIVPMAKTGLTENWILAAWILAGIITMCGAFILAGLSSLTEESGGVYEYLRLSFGNFFSFMFGWTDFTIIGTASIAAVGFIFSQTVNSLLPLPDPFAPLQHLSIGIIYPFANSGVKILTILMIILLTWINYLGVKKSGVMNNIVTSAKILGIVLLIFFGLFYLPVSGHSAGDRVPVIPLTGGSFFFNAIFAAMLNAFWAYDGWSNTSFITGEIKNPKRNVPIAIISGVCIAMLLYVLVNYVYMHVIPLNQIVALGENTIGAMAVAEVMIGKTGHLVIALLIIISVFSTMNAIIMTHSRIFFSMARERYFFPKAAHVHPVHRTPYISLLYTMIWSSILVVSGTFDILTNMVIFAGFFFYGLLAVALIKMKRKKIIKSKVVGYPLIPLVIILFSAALIINTIMEQPKQSFIGLLLMLTGIPFYYYFRKRAMRQSV
ncbi:MAG: amino acid permease [Ginsengibacter sp.]